MKKITRILAVFAALVLGAGIAGCKPDGSAENPPVQNPPVVNPVVYPDYINDPNYNEGEQTTSNRYVVNVKSAGGMPLNEVSVALKDADGTTLKTGISQNGKIEFSVALGEYTLEVQENSLPNGYYLDGTTYKTNPQSRDEVNISIPSKVSTDTPLASSYQLGDVMSDFTFVDCTGKTFTLSETLKTKKAVVLNFFYTACQPCQQEFPAIETAYKNFSSQIEFFGICYTGYSDTDSSLRSFKDSLDIPSLPLGMDNLYNMVSRFGVSAFPTTFIVDRYGMIAYQSTGSEPSATTWNALFAKFTSNDYTQDLTVGEGGDSDSSEEQQKPNVSMPASSEIEAVLNDPSVNATYHEDNSTGYVWPWVVSTDENGDPCISSSNVNVDKSISALVGEFDMKKGDLLSFEYNINTEAGNDLLYVVIDGDSKIPMGLSGNSNGWQSYNLYVADRDKRVEITFAFEKDNMDDDSVEEIKDKVQIRNLRISDSAALETPLDVIRPAADGLEGENPVRYQNYVTPVYSDPASGGDGMYHVGSVDGPLLLITLTQITPWTTLHMESNATETYYNTLYDMTYFECSNQLQDEGFAVTIAGKDFTAILQEYNNVNKAISSPNQLMPVTKELYDWAVSFCTQKAGLQNRPTYDNEWLEFCYYYDHYGPDHDNCLVDTDFSKGLSIYNNTYTAHLDTDTTSTETYNAETHMNRVEINYYANQSPRGNYYEFVAPKAGVYRIRSYNAVVAGQESTGIEHYLFIYDGNRNLIPNSEFLRDYDLKMGTESYDGFNSYIYLEANEKVYFRLAVGTNALGSFDFRIHYEGESYRTMFTATLAAGMYSTDDSGDIWLDAVKVVLEGGYFYVQGANGEADFSKPVYVSLIYDSYFMSSFQNAAGESGNSHSVQWLYDNGAFDNLGSRDKALLASYLGQVEEQDPDDKWYGFVQADEEIVRLLQTFSMGTGDLDQTEGNDWLAFAVYEEYFGA